LGYDEGAGDGQWFDSRHGNLVFLSARPHLPASDYMETLCHGLLAGSPFHSKPDMLFGCVKTSLTERSRALKKVDNFRNYRTIYPECKFIFIGDNGQGDGYAAEGLKLEAQDDIEIFLHQVRPPAQTPGYKKEWETKLGIIFYTNYIEAAIVAAKKQLIHPKGLRRVMVSTKDDFLRTFSPLNLLQFAQRVSEINTSIKNGNVLLQEFKLEDVYLLPTDSISFSSSSTLTSTTPTTSTMAPGMEPPKNSITITETTVITTTSTLSNRDLETTPI